MNEVLAIGLQSMQGDMNRLDQVAMNLANVLTPGYKRTVVVQPPIGASFASHFNEVGGGAAPVGPTSTSQTHAVDSRAGSLKATGQPLDFALTGKGFFEVMTEYGPAYTRQGSFQVDARGRLVNAAGHPVMGTSGEIQLGASNPTVATDGSVTSGGKQVGRFKVVEFESQASSQRVGDGLHTAASVRPLSPDEVQVRQGYLENSNVNSTQEMARLIQAMRHFEGMQKVMQGYDEMLGIAIRKLGETS